MTDLAPGWAAIIAGFIGALTGAASSTIATVVAQRAESRRNRAKLVMEAAITEFKAHGEAFGMASPLLTFVVHHDAVLRELERGALTPEKALEIVQASKALAGKLAAHERATVDFQGGPSKGSA